MTRAFTIVVLLFMGLSSCTEEDSKPVKHGDEPVAPGIRLEPPAGRYDAYVLEVTVSAEADGVSLAAALNRTPASDQIDWSDGPLTVRIESSASVQVLVRDGDGRIWGPYGHEYLLAGRDLDGRCAIQLPERLYYGPAESIPLSVTYSLPTALSAVQLTVDGKPAASFASAESPRGTTTITLPPLANEKGYDVTCKVAGPGLTDDVGNTVRVYVDATSPEAAWLTAGPYTPPTHYRLQAADAGSGVERAELCDTAMQYCLPMSTTGDGRFSFGTAFIPGAAEGFAVVARVYDNAGNPAILSAREIGVDELPDGAEPFMHAVTLTPAATFDFAAWLMGEVGETPTEVRTLAFSAMPSEALELDTGYNEFLFRRPGRSGWDTFGIYHAGVEVALPYREPVEQAPWLVYASHATLPGLQSWLVDVLPPGTESFARAWFEVPRLYFVEDLDGEGDWDESEPLFILDVPAGDDGEGPWLRRGAPLLAGLSEAVSSPSAITREVDVSCADCAAGGRLLGQRTTPASLVPAERTSWNDDLAALSPVRVALAGAPEDACLLFWDEDGNQVVNADEPRSFTTCGAAEATLRREKILTASHREDQLIVDGIPYGGTATGYVEVRDAADVPLLRTPLENLHDHQGTGRRELSLPLAGYWPSRLQVYAANGHAAVNLPGRASPITTTINIEVRDEGGQPVSAALETEWPGNADFRIYDETVPFVAVSHDPVYRPRVRALRDGYLSQWVYADEAFTTVPIVTAASAGRVEGYVRDGLGNPVRDAVIAWEADPWSARTYSRSDGWYAVPVLGTGRLSVTSPGRRTAATPVETYAAGVTERVDLTVPPDRLAFPAGMLSDPAQTWIEGSVSGAPFTDDLFVWAPLDAGNHTLHADGGLRRAFVSPGAIPGIALAEPAMHHIGWSDELLASTLTLRCGARLQLLAFGTAPLVDSPCWEWWADWKGQRFFLGRADPEGGMPSAGLKFWTTSVSAGGNPAAGQTVRFRDLLFNRGVEAETGAHGEFEVMLPYGFYRAETPGGTPYRFESGHSALLHVTHGDLPVGSLVLP